MAAGPGPDPSGDAVPGDPVPEHLTDAQKALRAQILATEHWSLLASRSTTQSEVLTRISISLTLVSAGLITLGLLGSATEFRGWFGAAVLGILVLLVVLGSITQLRVFNYATEDLAHVLAMNRLRAAYLTLDPGLEPFFMTGTSDDEEGAAKTYFPYASRDLSQVLASSMMLILLVNVTLLGLLAGAIVFVLGGAIGWSIATGVAVAVAAFVLWMARGYRLFRQVHERHRPLRRSDG